MGKKIYLFDTNVFLSDSIIKILSKYGENEIVIPLSVIKEMDNHKGRTDGCGVFVRNCIRFLETIKYDLKGGADIIGRSGKIFTANQIASETDQDIIEIAKGYPKQDEPIIVTNDFNVRIRAAFWGIASEQYETDKAAEDFSEIYSGYRDVEQASAIVDKFHDGEDVFVDRDVHPGLITNEFLVIKSEENSKHSALALFRNYKRPLEKIDTKFKELSKYGLKTRNKEQTFALNLLLDPSVKVVTLLGRAGTGKTLLALASGLAQTESSKKGRRSGNIYNKILVSRPIKAMGEDIGFLPGTKEEKMAPWIQPIMDNLEYLFGDIMAVENCLDAGLIEIEAPTYIRGRSIPNTFIIIDEVQNITKHELKTIMTRVGEGSKIVLTGDIEQIDNKFLNELTNGLSHAVEMFKPYPLAGHVTLERGERSEVATLSSKIL